MVKQIIIPVVVVKTSIRKPFVVAPLSLPDIAHREPILLNRFWWLPQEWSVSGFLTASKVQDYSLAQVYIEEASSLPAELFQAYL